MGALKRASERISSGLEGLFYRLGLFVGKRPLTVIVASSVVCALSLLGLLRFHREARIEKLWAEPGTPLFDDKSFVNKYFPEEYGDAFQLGVREPRRLKSGQLDAGILEASVVHQLYKIHEGIIAINASDKKRKYTFDQYAFPRRGNNYWISSILALWEFDRETIMNLTTADILDRMNEKPLKDPWNGGVFTLDSLVAHVVRDADGLIVRASAIRSVYRFYTNKTFDSSEGREVDVRGKDFSLQYGDWITKKWNQFDTMVPFTWAGFDKGSEELLNGDIILITLGYTLIFTYVSFNLGRFNKLHGRVWLAASGIVSTGMAIGMAFGICSAIGLFYGPVHSALPFLLIGIGVDDMFVIVQAWDTLTDEDHKKLTVAERLAKTLSLAGTSVTVTSITDFVAFCVGASTILPALQSFCLYAGFGVLFDLLFQVTFFAATLALDARRVDANRNYCLPCLKVTDIDFWPGHPLPERILQRLCEKYYSVYLLKPATKLFVIVASLALFGVGMHAIFQLEIHFDYFWFLPEDSALTTFVRQQDKYFGDTLPVEVVTGRVNYTSREVQDKLSALANQTANSRYTKAKTVDPWIWGFRAWAKEKKVNTTGKDFYPSLLMFLQTPHGRHYRRNLRLEDDDDNNNNNITLTASRFSVETIALPHTRDEVAAMNNIRGIASSIIFPSGHSSIAYHWAFLPWSTNKVIDEELFRSILLAMAAVFLVTLFLIADIFSAFLVLICVAFSLVDICLVIFHWDLTINTVTTVMIVMSIGLSVDYSAHIAHMFMVHQGTRTERARAAVNGIGVSVLNGGISTFLAFVLLAASKSYVFRVFFRVFLASVIFGLFHGLALLPIILTFVGSQSHKLVMSRDTTATPKKQPLANAGKLKNGSAPEMNGVLLQDADWHPTRGIKRESLPSTGNGTDNAVSEE